MKGLDPNSIPNKPIYPLSSVEADLEKLNNTFDSLGKLEAGKSIVYRKEKGDKIGTFVSVAKPIDTKTDQTGKGVLGGVGRLFSQTAQSLSGRSEIDDPIAAARDMQNLITHIHDNLLDRKERLTPEQLNHCLKTLSVLREKMPGVNSGIDKLRGLVSKKGKQDATRFEKIVSGIGKSIDEMEGALSDIIRVKEIKEIPGEKVEMVKRQVEQTMEKRKAALDTFSANKRKIAEKSESIMARRDEILLRKKYDAVVEEVQSNPLAMKQARSPAEKQTSKGEKDISVVEEEARVPTFAVRPAASSSSVALPPPPPMPKRTTQSAEEAFIERRLTSRLGDTGAFYTLSKGAEEKIKAKLHDIGMVESFIADLKDLPESEEKIKAKEKQIETLKSEMREIEINGKVGIDLSSAKERFSKYFTDELYMILGAYYANNPDALEQKKKNLSELRESLRSNVNSDQLDPNQREIAEKGQRGREHEQVALSSNIALIEQAVRHYRTGENKHKKEIFERSSGEWGQVLDLSGNMMTAIITVLNDRITGRANEPPPDTMTRGRAVGKESSLEVEKRKQEASPKTVSTEDLQRKREDIFKKKAK